MKFIYCAITVAAVVACAKGSESSTPATSAAGSTTAAAASGNVGRPVVPAPTAAPNVATGAPSSHTSSAPAQRAPAIARVAGPTGSLSSKRKAKAPTRDTGTAASTRDTGAAASNSTTAKSTSAAAASAPGTSRSADSVKVNQFMSYDKSKKTVTIDIFAAYNTNLGGFNFNGGYSGNDTITVPEGWTVVMPFTNKDAIPHSAIVIQGKMPLPVMPHDPAIPLAYTTHLTDGLQPQGGHDTMRFKASPAGNYFLACGVAGHATSGMWIRFDVSKSASVPTYAMGKQ